MERTIEAIEREVSVGERVNDLSNIQGRKTKPQRRKNKGEVLQETFENLSQA